MGTRVPDYQEFFDLPDGTTIGCTRFKTLEADNQIPIAPPMYTSQGSAGVQLIDINDVAQVGWFYIPPTGIAHINNAPASRQNKNVTFITIHKRSNGTA